MTTRTQPAPGVARLQREAGRERTSAVQAIIEAPAESSALAIPSEEQVELLAEGRDRSDLAGKDLDTLADEARWHKDQAEHHHRRALYHFVEMGRRLIEAKARLKHGAFQPYVVSEVGVSEQHARRLMDLSRNRSRVSDLPPETSLRAALETVQEQKREERAALPRQIKAEVLLPAYLPCTIDVADAISLPLPDGAVDLIVTSPPYGLGIDYSDSDDNSEYAAYLGHTRMWAAEMHRIAAPQGRICLNVPLDITRGGVQPMYADWLDSLRAAGWRYRCSIVWNEGTINKSVARGSVDSPSSPHVIAPVEMILVMHKGDWNLRQIGTHNLEHAQWLEWTNGLWTFGGEHHRDHPAPFPEELPRRCISLFSFDTAVVCDPFVGSGTTAIVAYRLGRTFYGFDQSSEYVALARGRVVQAVAAA
jgi:site-specific DNA-methyltransferase (adenine-specific)